MTKELDEIQKSEFRQVWSDSYRKMGTDLPGTIQDLKKIHQAMPQNLTVLRSLATLVAKSGDHHSALGYISLGLSLSPNNFQFLRDLANHKLMFGPLDEALVVADTVEMLLGSAIDADEDAIATPSAIRGLVLSQQGQKKQARSLLEEAQTKSRMIFIDFDTFEATLSQATSEDW